MLLRVRFRQGYTLADVCLVPVVIDAIDVHRDFIAIYLQTVPFVSRSLDELGAMRAMRDLLTHAHG